MDTWQIILSVMAGVGLSAACGFRIFIPPLIIAIAAKAGHVNLGTEFAWMGSDIALVAFGLAAVLEVGAYYIPWLDNALDTIAAPVAVVAGTITSAAVFGDMSPWLKWTLAAIAGGGAAGAVQITTTVTRGASSAITGGMGNWAVSTAEGIGSIFTAVLAIVIPVLVFSLFVLFVGFLVWKNPAKLYRNWRARKDRLREPPLLAAS
ncbi:MAG: DUF4126 domain-containing protein [Verrucomicrobiia bacterium]|jgi:hypothetical protein